MSKLLNYIEEKNNVFIKKIISAIKDDKDCLIDLGISERDMDKKNLIPTLISEHISNPYNQVSIDSFLKYFISEYLYDDDELHLIDHYVSADVYTSRRALYVFKSSDLYFCYDYNSEKIESLITKEPEVFCWNVASSIMKDYEMENENLNDEFFKDSDPINILQLNFNFYKL